MGDDVSVGGSEDQEDLVEQAGDRKNEREELEVKGLIEE